MTDHIKTLRTYNDWRNDRTQNRTLEDFGITPRMITEAIDSVLDELEIRRRVEKDRRYGEI